MVKEVAGKCLLPAVENRDPLETKFAEAVGETLDAAMEGLAKAHTDALEIVADEEKKVQSLQSATEAEMQATEKKNDAENALAAHAEEEKGL